MFKIILTLLSGKASRCVAIAIFLCTCRLFADTCAAKQVNLVNKERRSRFELIRDISVALHTSALWEIAANDSLPKAYEISSSGSEMTLSELVLVLDPSGSLTCTINDNVIHVFNSTALSAEENPLNHMFRGFSVPSVAELFAMSFRIRLNNEAFSPSSADQTAGSTGGVLPSDASNATLKSEVILNISARDLFLHEAKQVPMVLSTTITVDPSQAPADLWKKGKDKLMIEVLK